MSTASGSLAQWPTGAPAFGSVTPALPCRAITPDWAWQGSTGQGVRVAVIDSGINATHRAVGGRISGYVSIRRSPSGFAYDKQPHQDVIGHGTACAGIIRSIAPDCELYSIQVIGPTGVGDGAALAAGLEWAVVHGMHVCNVSLGTPSVAAAALLRDVADRAYFRDIIIVAAANNESEPSFPWMLSSVISVSATASADPYTFYTNPRPPAEFAAAGLDVPIPWMEGWTTGSGSSFAAPHLAGVVTRIRSKHPRISVAELKVVLRALASNATSLDPAA
jgi:subtilisin family serine protease